MATHRPRSLIRVHSRIFAAFKFGPTSLRTRSVRRASGFVLTPEEFENLVTFVRKGLLDPRAERQNLCSLIPSTLPSGMPALHFEGCPEGGN